MSADRGEPSFGHWLKERRQARGLTQRELAERTFCALVTIKKIEADERRPSRQVAERLLAVLAVPAGEQSGLIRLARLGPGAAIAAAHSPNDETLSDDAPELHGQLRPAGQAPAGLVGRRLRGYLLGESIGSGGFGVVYRAEQPAVGRAVALKVIRPELADHPDFIRRFEAEARLVARLEHPHIVPLYDYWREPGGAYLAMRLLRGGSLHDALAGGPPPLAVVARVLDQIGAALQAAHRAGVVHRDLKPANILLDEAGNAYLADFGIARDLADAPDAPGAIVGSPAYLAPEQIRADPVSPRTDIYILGLLAYELLSGAQPFAPASGPDLIRRQLEEPLPALAGSRPGLSPAVDAALQRATAKEPAGRYADVSDLIADLRAALPVTFAEAAPPRAPGRNPFKGLRPFGEADAADFFGRAQLAQELLARLAGGDSPADPDAGERPAPPLRLLALVGPSGSGKSSLVRAGLVPALRAGALPGSESWFVADLVPGARPLDALAAALRALSVRPPADLAGALGADPGALARAAAAILAGQPEAELLLVIDQLEELFTLVADEAQRRAFIEALVAALSDPAARVRAILCLRADFFDRPLRYAGLGELISRGAAPVAPLTPPELRAAILGPSARVGLPVEPDLVVALLDELRDRAAALPLLQYALTELYERSPSALTLAGYRAIGGVSGALARRAEATYAELGPHERELARRLLLRLIAPGEAGEDTRRRAALGELREIAGPRADGILDLLGRYRLLSFDRDPASGEPTVDLAHEALIGTWARLSAWAAAAREQLLARRRLSAAAAEWAAAGREPAFLAAGGRLAALQPLAEPAAADAGVALSAVEAEFLSASVAEAGRRESAERERQASLIAAGRLRALAMVLLVAVIATAGLALFAWAQRSAARAAERESLALARAGEALVEVDRRPALALARARAALSGELADAPPLVARAVYRSFEGALLRAAVPAHSGPLRALAWSGDGRLVTAGEDGLARIWKAGGAAGPDLAGAAGPLRAAAWSPDGRALVIAGADGTARIWDTASGDELRRLTGHGATIGAAGWSPDGARLVTASYDGTARIWDAASGAELRVLTGHTGALRAAGWSPDGARIATAGDDGTARIWDAASGEQLRALVGHGGVVSGLAWSPDGERLATGGADGTARIWDAVSGAELRRLSDTAGWVWAVAWSPRGGRLVSAGFDGALTIWDAATGSPARRLPGAAARPWAVAWSPDGRTIAAGYDDGAARLWDVSSDARLIPPPSADPPAALAWSPGGGLLALGRPDGAVEIRPARNPATALRTLAAPGRAAPYLLSWSPDARRLLVSYVDGATIAWDAERGEPLGELGRRPGPLADGAWSPDGQRVLTISGDGSAQIWALAGGAPLELPGRARATSAAWSPDGGTIVIGDERGQIRLLASDTLALRLLRVSPALVRALAWSPDGSRIAAAGDDGVVRVWSAGGGAPLPELPGHAGSVLRLAWSPDGARLISGGDDGAARLWDVASGRELRALPGQGEKIAGLAWLADGRTALSGGPSGAARLTLIDDALIVADLTRRACALAPAELPAPDEGWAGCAAELGRLRADLAGYDSWATEFLPDPPTP